MYGALLINALYKVNPRINVFGVGGERMENAGAEIIVNSSSISVVGFTEILSKLPKVITIFRKVRKFILTKHPSVVILIDYPGFNLHLAKKIKKEKIPLLYYVPPQIWAWDKRRVKTLSSCVDRIAVILPFEKSWYQGKDCKVDYVGHPLIEILREWEGSYLYKGKEEKIVGILPGSRKIEIQKILPLMLKTAELMKGNMRFVLPLAPGIEKKTVSKYLKKSSVRVEIFQDGSFPVMKSADLLLLASGTATLEAAYFTTPMIIVYKVSLITYLLAKILVRVPWIGLVNLIAGKQIVPEFIQGRARPEKMARIATEYLVNQEKTKKMKEELSSVIEELSVDSSSAKVAQIAFELCKEE